MKPESEVGLFREERQRSEFLAFRAGSEIARKVAFANGVGASLNCKGSTEIASRRIKYGQIVERQCDARMFWPQRFLLDGNRPLNQLLYIRVIAFRIVDARETVERERDTWMF